LRHASPVLPNSHSCLDGKRPVVDRMYGRNTRAAIASAAKLIGEGD
jgi:hypothetical protein